MLAFVVVSHGSFAQGVVDSSYMIFGKQDKVQTVTFQLDEEPNELADKLAAAVARFDADDQVLFLVDLWGGSPFNAASRIIAEHTERMGLITGLNLPMLIEAYTVRDKPIDEVIAHLEETGKIGIKHLKLLQDDGEDEPL
ncbi:MULTISPECIES: PTS sugar transporter subunit IIA [Lactiplantibacillus]|jgi:PTS system mannose-specific IIA component/PTS system mannose-specific IIB component|uniref:PTS sugar transporter subunit IIA n=1 Tax=Lactiplantibacillus TaxID=2767842 RepID=UPI00073C5AAB|nr:MULTISPECIES: PTS sugar transporter subunit IIA [Lactiplantibacillus]GEK63913.1 PTS mannose transporter subunit IIA [Lactobacillus japonicus]KTF01313.1 PTS system mannose-specific IIA component [Lactiplantibacillus plantarum]KZT82987.1 PTS system mannose-specific IIA component [Lactiplantibacillus plantarum]MBU5275547.1 PTS sugar transporter subunit IIA [Lactiplantibacillus argentoratensis]MCB7462355.1 PTS sugar transporter subunit IIA [Lactiplantibacillus argentoratensis]